MQIKGINFTWFGHDAFRLAVDEKIIYLDPYKIEEGEEADLILVSHEHHDHCDVDSLKKLSTDTTTIVTTPLAEEKVKDLQGKKIYLTPGEETTVTGFTVTTIPAYNVDKFRSPGKPYHSKGKKLGFILEIKGTRIYFAGDTDPIDEMEELDDIDIALLPISGKYVMTVDEAVEAVEKIKPKIAIPMHVGRGIGSLDDKENFKEKVGSLAEVKMLEMS